MKNVLIIVIVLGLALVGIFWYSTRNTEDTQQQEEETQNQVQQQAQINAQNCIADECLEVENLNYPVGSLPEDVQQALSEAINDEYKAQATYQKVVDKFGQVRPFAMIVGSEGQHISSLISIYEKYGLEVPANTWAEKVPTFNSVSDACSAGVEAEIANVALYDQLFADVKDYEDITLVFTQLRDASQTKHLPAFEKCAN